MTRLAWWGAALLLFAIVPLVLIEATTLAIIEIYHTLKWIP